MLRRKEQADIAEREKEQAKFDQMTNIKSEIQKQLQEQEQRREEAYQEYQREREMVDNIIKRMVSEDLENMKLQRQKKEQSMQDMVLSV